MARVIVFGATGSLGGHTLRLALDAGHELTAFVRTPSKLASDSRARAAVREGDLHAMGAADLAQVIRGHDALINCAGHVREGQLFVDLVDRLASAVESLPAADQPVSWFLAGAALLDLDPSGRRGVDLPKVASTYWPHRANFDRLSRSGMDWRLLCPGPMVDHPPLGLSRMRISRDTLPVPVPGFARTLPAPLVLPIFASLIPQMIVPYADAAAFMLAHLDRGDPVSRHRVGIALPIGMKGKKDQ